jgi:hypothetical protein
MAHGFERERGSRRGYVNRSNPNFITGLRLSRREYDTFTMSLGARNVKASQAELRTRIRAAQGELRSLQRELDALERVASPDALAGGRKAQTEAARLIARQREQEASRDLLGLDRSGKGTRRYHALLDAYIEDQKRRGNPMSRKQAAASPEFQEALKLVRGKPNPTGNERIAQQNKFARARGFAKVGGEDEFAERYRSRYGRGFQVVRRYGTRGNRIRRRNVG